MSRAGSAPFSIQGEEVESTVFRHKSRTASRASSTRSLWPALRELPLVLRRRFERVSGMHLRGTRATGRSFGGGDVAAVSHLRERTCLYRARTILAGMKTTAWVVGALFAGLLSFSAQSAAKVNVELKDAQGKKVGSALMYESNGMVIQLDLHG